MRQSVHESEPIERPEGPQGPARPERVYPATGLPDKPPFGEVPIDQDDVSEPTHRSSAKPLVYGLLAYLGVLLVLVGVAYAFSLIWA